MSDKASGNGTESHGDDDKGLVEGNFPDGEELSIDPYSGDQLDLTEPWWADIDNYERGDKENRRISVEESDSAEEAKDEEVANKKSESRGSQSDSKEVEKRNFNEQSEKDSKSGEEILSSDDANEKERVDKRYVGPTEDKKLSQETRKSGETEDADEESVLDIKPLIRESAPIEDLAKLFGKKRSNKNADEESRKGPDDQGSEDQSEKEGKRGAKESMPWEEDRDEFSPTAAKPGSPKKARKKKRAPNKKAQSFDESFEDKAGDKKLSGKSRREREDGFKIDTGKVDGVVGNRTPRAAKKKRPSIDKELGEIVVVAAPPQPKTEKPAEKEKAGCWTVFATLFFILTLLVVLAVAVAGYLSWSRFSGFAPEVISKAQVYLEERGLYFDYEDGEYQFPRGVVLTGVTIFESEARQVPRVKFSNLGINIDIIGLIKDQTAVSAVEFSFLDSSLTFFKGGNPVAQLEEISAEILASSRRVDVERFSGRIGGLVLRASGSLSLPRSGASDGAFNNAAFSEPFGILGDSAMLENFERWLEVQANGNPLMLDVEFSSDDGLKSLALDGSLSGSDFLWCGVPMTRASASFGFDAPSKMMEFYSFQFGHGEGELSGMASLDLENNVLTLDEVESGVDLVLMLSAFDAEMAKKLAPIRFLDAPQVQLSGSILLEDLANSNVEIFYDHLLGLVYTSDSRDFPVSQIKTAIKLSGGSLIVKDATAQLLGGDFNMGGKVSLVDGGYPFSLAPFRLDRVPLDSIGEWFGIDSRAMNGDVAFEFRGSGTNDISDIRGGGSILVTEAKLTEFPIVGEIQDFLGKVVPAFGVRTGDALSGTYIIESGILLTNDLTVTQVGANVLLDANVNFKRETTKFTARASMDPTVVTGMPLEGKEVIIEGEGPWMKPSIRLKRFPFEFAAEELSSLLGTSAETMEILQGLIEGEEDLAKMVSDQLQKNIGSEGASSEGNGLVDGIIKNLPLPDKGDSEAVVPIEESEPALPVPEVPETGAEPDSPSISAPARALPVPAEG
jgi:hypothetical protein